MNIFVIQVSGRENEKKKLELKLQNIGKNQLNKTYTLTTIGREIEDYLKLGKKLKREIRY